MILPFSTPIKPPHRVCGSSIQISHPGGVLARARGLAAWYFIVSLLDTGDIVARHSLVVVLSSEEVTGARRVNPLEKKLLLVSLNTRVVSVPHTVDSGCSPWLRSLEAASVSMVVCSTGPCSG